MTARALTCWFLLLSYVPLAPRGPDGLALCFAADGHVGIKDMGRLTCDGDAAGGGHCGGVSLSAPRPRENNCCPCVDIPLTTPRIVQPSALRRDRRAAGARTAGGPADWPAAQATLIPGGWAAHSPPPCPAPHLRDPLTTIVLLI